MSVPVIKGPEHAPWRLQLKRHSGMSRLLFRRHGKQFDSMEFATGGAGKLRERGGVYGHMAGARHGLLFSAVFRLHSDTA